MKMGCVGACDEKGGGGWQNRFERCREVIRKKEWKERAAERRKERLRARLWRLRQRRAGECSFEGSGARWEKAPGEEDGED